MTDRRSDRRSSWATRSAFATVVVVTLLLAHAAVTFAVPANPEPFLLEQPDGTQFVARQFGDEWMNGTETEDGYTIVQHAPSGYWSYADVTQAGSLVASPYVVGRDLPYALPQRIRPAVSPNSPALAGPQSLGFAPPPPFTGTRKMLVILVRFANKTSSTTPTAWQSRFFGPSNSVKDFYNETSYGNLNIVPAAETSGTVNDGIVGWVTLPTNHPNFAGAIDGRAQTLAVGAITAASAFVNFSAFDTNADNFLSESELLIVIIVAGNEGSFGPACSPSVWGHRWGIAGGVSVDSKTASSYAMFGEMHCRTSSPPGQQATLGIIVHETGHLLGLPDLYDTDQSSVGVGDWSVMSGGSWNGIARPGDSPSFMDPWSKVTLGWVTPTLVTGTLTNRAIPDAATSPTVFKFLNGTQYFLVENRHGASYDAGLPSTGLLIWHIDDTKTDNEEECSPGGVTGLPACTTTVHPWVRLVQADNQYDLEHGTDSGDAGDPFPGTSNRRAFTSTSTPSSRLYSGSASNISITNISDSLPTMTATLSVVVPPSITVTAPNGGQTWATGVLQTITWTSVSVSGNVKIELSRNGGATWTAIANGTANDGVHTWTATTPATNRARIRICSLLAPSVCDTSNADFLIGRAILLTAPNGGQTWAIGSSKTVQWKSSMVTGNVKIDISRNGGTSFSTLFASVANDGSQAWTVAGAASTTARIRVCSISTPVICDASNANFTISSGATGPVNLVAAGVQLDRPAVRGNPWFIRLLTANSGTGITGTAPASVARIYFSLDTTGTTSDYLVTSFNIPSLVAGATNDQSKTITFPMTVPPGTYYLIAQLDATNTVIGETNENNWYYVATVVPVQAPSAPGRTPGSSSTPTRAELTPLLQH